LSRRNDGAARTKPSLLELCRVATEEDESQMKEIKEITPSEFAKRSKISAISLISAGLYKNV
jgi:hypothetical protein